MTFNGGTWIIRDNGFGAGIGSGSSSGSQYDTTLYTSKVTINNGTFDLETSHAATGLAPASVPAPAAITA
ncbi:MAG: hypothetical protein ACLVHV_04710 [Oscillospiraceae bacterium]